MSGGACPWTPAAVIPDDLVQAADAQARRAGEFITRVGDPSRRDELATELSVLQAESQHEIGTLRVVVFGTGSAGKTSKLPVFQVRIR